MRSEHPSNTKRAGVCTFYEDYLPVLRRDDLCALSECIVTEMKLGKNLFFSCHYRSLSQTPMNLNYCQSFHLTLLNIDETSPFCSVVVGDFNSRCRDRWVGDVNSNAGKELDSLTTTAGYT